MLQIPYLSIQINPLITSQMQNKKYILKILTFPFLLFSVHPGNAQPALTFSMTNFFNWQPSVINHENISYVPLASRTKSPNGQVFNSMDTNVRVLYCPDGMNNFGPYVDSASQFNLFNFSHWQSIDILTWFGGSASVPVVIPSKAWVDAAHKNGVKVIGTVFLSPLAYGGTQTIAQNFLQQDTAGNFLAVAKMIELANYNNFDGWFLNFETSVNSATGNLVSSFVRQLDSAYGGEVIWYDAMLQSGTVSYQNRLDASNAYFFRHSTGLFTNYNWSFATTVTNSGNYATSLSRSPFDVYTGVDMWPSRTAQPAFTSYTWIDKIVTNGIAKTSMALFATNFTFNYASFSTFNNNPNDYANFYATERKIFSGLDQNPFVADATWKGISNYVPVRTTIQSFPFETDFNTGHGLNYYDNGGILLSGGWHNMSHQSILPSWTFYTNGTMIDYDFNDAWSGGSSLSVTSVSSGSYDIPLFSTNLITTSNLLNVKLVLKSSSSGSIDSIAVELLKKDSTQALSVFHPACNGTWEDLFNSSTPIGISDTIISINIHAYASSGFTLDIGKIGVAENSSTSVSNLHSHATSLLIFPNPSKETVSFLYSGDSQGRINIYNLEGKQIITQLIHKAETQKINLPDCGVYLYELISKDTFERGKLIIH